MAIDKDCGCEDNRSQGGAEGAKPPRATLRAPRRSTVQVLASCIMALHDSLVRQATDADELQVLGNFWDEYKHQLERILRSGR